MIAVTDVDVSLLEDSRAATIPLYISKVKALNFVGLLRVILKTFPSRETYINRMVESLV